MGRGEGERYGHDAKDYDFGKGGGSTTKSRREERVKDIPNKRSPGRVEQKSLKGLSSRLLLRGDTVNEDNVMFWYLRRE